jgi:hypothetical protein
MKHGLKDNENCVGLYFQSQEGEINFCEFGNPENVDNCFRPEIFNGNSDNRFYRDVKDHIQPRQETAIRCESKELDRLVTELEIAHYGFDNFVNEIEPARHLDDYLCSADDSSSIYNSSFGTALITLVAECYVGNSYGYSWRAVNYYKNILLRIPGDTWNEYLSNKHYYNASFISTLAYSDKRARKLQELIKGIEGVDQEAEFFGFNNSDFWELKDALIMVANEEWENDSPEDKYYTDMCDLYEEDESEELPFSFC